MVLRQALIGASNRGLVKSAATANPVTRGVINKFVAGETASDVVRVATELAGSGLHCTVDFLSEDRTDPELADSTTGEYLALLAALAEGDLTDRAEISIKLSAIGLCLPEHGKETAFANAHRVCAVANDLGIPVTIDMEGHSTTELVRAAVRELRQEFPTIGAVVQSYLRRAEADCAELGYAGSRVRLCKGAYAEPAAVAFQTRQEIDLSFVRCMRALMRGAGTPMIATHDSRLIEIAGAIAVRTERERGTYEFQMLYGVRSEEQKRLASLGEKVRVYLPYGEQWYPYLVRRMAEHPANLGMFVRALSPTG